MNINLAKSVAKKAVVESGKIILKNFGKTVDVSFKGERDMVTDIDLRSEKLILSLIKKHFPEHGILSEESGTFNENAEYVWVVDPIDGTMNYRYGMAPFRVGICLLQNKKPIISAIYNPIKNHLYFAEKNKGTTLNGKKIKVSNRQNLIQSVVMTHLSSNKEARMQTISLLEKVFSQSMQVRMFGSTFASMTYIAEGKFDVYFNVRQKPWDILPGGLIIEEAGGIVTDIAGREVGLDSSSLLATSGKIHKEMLELLKTSSQNYTS